MCQFLSAIVMQDGTIYERADATDSHEDLIAWLGLKDDRDVRMWCRVEFTPQSAEDYPFPDRWNLRVDETDSIPWWSDDMADRVKSELTSRVSKMLVSDHRKILLGGCWILWGTAKVDRAVSVRVICMLGSSNVGEMRGSSNVGVMLESSNVGEMWGSSKVGEMRGSSNVGVMWESSKVGVMRESSNVGEMRGSSKVEIDSRSTEFKSANKINQ